MTTQHLIEAGQVVHQAASILASLEFIDQAAAQQIGPMAEAVANVFMVVYYQAETGRATPADFQEAMNTLQQVLPGSCRYRISLMFWALITVPRIARSGRAFSVCSLDSWRDEAVFPQQNDAPRTALVGGAE